MHFSLQRKLFSTENPWVACSKVSTTAMITNQVQVTELNGVAYFTRQPANLQTV